MIDTNKKFQLTSQQAKKLNILMPKGYKIVTQQQFKKKAMIKPKKKTLLGLPVTPQIVNTSISMNLAQNGFSINPIVQPPLLGGRSTKNTKFMGIPSYESLPESEYIINPTRSYQKIPINFDYSSSIQKRNQILSTPIVFMKLKNHPHIFQLEKVQPEQYSLSFKDIQRKVNLQKDNYKLNDLIADISKLCLKIYESYPRDSNQYQNTLSIQKYFKSLTKVQKTEINTILPPMNIVRQPSNIPQVKKKPPMRVNDLNAALTIKQKRQLGQRIKKLPSQNLQQICYIVFQNLQNKQYSFDLDTLHIKKIRQLQQYVNSCLDYLQLKDNDQENIRINQDDDGEQSSFIIEGDGQEEQTKNYDYLM